MASVCTRYPDLTGDFVFAAAFIGDFTGDLTGDFDAFAFDATGFFAPFVGEVFAIAFLVGDGVAVVFFVAVGFVGDAVAVAVTAAVDGFAGYDTVGVVVFDSDAVIVAIFAYSAAAFLSFS